MYIYHFVQSHPESLFHRPNHRQLIEENAREGWRFVTAIPSETDMPGRILHMDLVFEKEVPPETEVS